MKLSIERIFVTLYILYLCTNFGRGSTNLHMH